MWSFAPTAFLARDPALAHEALKLEDKVGTMPPCNVIVQELAPGGSKSRWSIPV